MRRFINCVAVLALAVALSAGRPAPLRACPSCSEAVPATSGAEADDARRESEAYNQSIYLMVAMPYLLLGGFGYVIYRGLRRNGPTPAEGPDSDDPSPGV